MAAGLLRGDGVDWGEEGGRVASPQNQGRLRQSTKALGGRGGTAVAICNRGRECKVREGSCAEGCHARGEPMGGSATVCQGQAEQATTGGWMPSSQCYPEWLAARLVAITKTERGVRSAIRPRQVRGRGGPMSCVAHVPLGFGGTNGSSLPCTAARVCGWAVVVLRVVAVGPNSFAKCVVGRRRMPGAGS